MPDPRGRQPVRAHGVTPDDVVVAARHVFDIGHVPVTAADLARSRPPSRPDAGRRPSTYADEIATRLILRCDAVLRTPGVSVEADILLERARREGKPVYRCCADIPAARRPSMQL